MRYSPKQLKRFGRYKIHISELDKITIMYFTCLKCGTKYKMIIPKENFKLVRITEQKLY